MILPLLILILVIFIGMNMKNKENMSITPNYAFYDYQPYNDSVTAWDYYWEQPWWERVVGRRVGPVAPGVRGWWYSNRY